MNALHDGSKTNSKKNGRHAETENLRTVATRWGKNRTRQTKFPATNAHVID
jgi:hypothetical protein